jgi:HAD superfamily hydrolase (TIGR01509 family)
MKKVFFFLVLLPLCCIHAAGCPVHPDIVVFDFGGVVNCTDYEIYTKKVQKALGLGHSQARSLIRKARKTKDSDREAFWQIYQTKSGLLLPFNWAKQFEHLKKESLTINPAIYKIIKELKKHGCKVAMLSNISTARAADIRKLGLYKPFHPAVLSCDINAEKPSQKAFKALLERLGNAAPERCFFIDDKKANVKAAIRLGFQAVQYESSKKLRWKLAQRNILPYK